MKQLKNRLFIALITIFLSNVTIAQDKIFDTDVMLYTKPFSENLLIINPNEGEIISFATVGEPIISAMLNRENGVFYIITSSHMYQGELESGEITDEYHYYEADPKDPMAKARFIPFGISNTGRAVLMHTGDLDMSTNPPKVPIELYVADINSKSKSVLYDMTAGNINPNFFPITKDGEFLDVFKVKDTKTNKNIHLDLKTNEVIKEVDINSLKDRFPELSTYKESVSVNSTFPNIATYNYSKAKQENVIIIYDKDIDKVILKESYNPLSGKTSYGFAGYNESTNSYYLAKQINNFDEPEPNIEDYDIMKPGAMEKYMKASEEWRNNAFKPDNYDAVIYDDLEMTNEVASFNKTRNVFIYKGKYAWIPRNYEIELYNLQTGETAWTIDTDF